MKEMRRKLRRHRELHRIVDRIRLLVEAPADVLPEERVQRLMAWELVDLACRLDRQFALEEKDGYMTQVASSRPELLNRVEKLRGDHDKLRQQLGKIVARLDTPRFTADRLRRDVRSLVKRLERHESAEIHLLVSSVNDDIGVGD